MAHPLSPEGWPAIIARAEGEGLRPIAASYGVSPVTIRAVLRRAGCAELLADSTRRRALETAAPLPPPAQAKIPAARHAEVRALRRRHPRAAVATVFGVSRATIWRITRRAPRQEGVRDR
jgi:transposase